MPSHLIEYRLRVRSQDNTTDDFIVSSVVGDTLPYLTGPPSGDGSEFDPLTGQSRAGAFTFPIVDAITSGTSRALTSHLEDANFRQQLLWRYAFGEYRIDAGVWVTLVAGYLSRLSLVSAAVYEAVVSDLTQQQRRVHAFAPKVNPSDQTKLENVSDYLARWPNRGCLFGGPVIGGFFGNLGVDLGGWQMTIQSTTSSNLTFLKFVQGYGAPTFLTRNKVTDGEIAKPVNDAVRPLRQLAQPWAPGFSVPQHITTVDDANLSYWPGIVIEVRQKSGTLLGYYQPTDGQELAVSSDDSSAVNKQELVSTWSKYPGAFIRGNELVAAHNNETVLVRAYTILPSDLSPIYYVGHPIDLETSLWTGRGVPVDSAAATAAKNAIGAAVRLALKITELPDMAAFVEQAIHGPFGIGLRTSAAGQLAFFATRILTTLPTKTFGAADVRHDPSSGGPTTFEVDESSAVYKLTIEQQRFSPASTTNPQLHGFVSSTETYERTNGDPGAKGAQEAHYTIPGMVSLDGTIPSPSALFAWVDHLARELFDRYGRGLIIGTVPALRGGALDPLPTDPNYPVQLGDLVINTLPQLPNHNKRLLDDNSVPGRVMQIIRITPAPSGAEIKLADAGPNAAAITTLPTLSIAQSADQPRTVAALTVTNAATLNAAGYGVRIGMAATTGAAPASTDYTTVLTYAPGQIPTGAIPLPPAIAGRTVYAIARTESATAFPSAYTTAVSVALSNLDAPTGLTATPSGSDGTQCLLAWTVGTNASKALVDVRLRLTADTAATYATSWTLEPGSNRYTLEWLTPGFAYTAGVRHRDPVTGDLSALVEVAFTAGAPVVTLQAPTYATGFSGGQNDGSPVGFGHIMLLSNPAARPQRDGVYGIAVHATELPSFVEVAEALETGVGTGTYGSFTTVGTVPSQATGWTIWQRTAANDGLRRQLKARHIRDGATPSAYTTVVTVTPWAPVRLPPTMPVRTLPYYDDSLYAPQADQSFNLQSGILPASGVVEGSATRALYRHREETAVMGPDTDGDVAVTFGNTYQNAPQVTFRGGQWVTFSNTLGTTVKQRSRIQAINVTQTGFTSRAQITNPGATTGQAQDFPSGNSVSTAGGTTQISLSPGGANDSVYTCNYYVQVTVNANAANFCTATLIVAIETSTDGGTTWVERATFSYSASPLSGPPPYSAATQTWTEETHSITVSGLTSGNLIRLRAKSFVITNGGTGSFTLRGGDGAGTNTETYRGLTYTTASDTVESAIPSTGDSVLWAAQEVA